MTDERLSKSLRLNFGLLYPSIFLAIGFGVFPTSNDRRRSEDLMDNSTKYTQCKSILQTCH